MKGGRKPPNQVTLARALSKLGILSRSQTIQAIQGGRIQVNGATVEDPGKKVNLKRDRIFLDGKKIDSRPRRVYLMLHKPRGLITTREDEKGRETVFSCLEKVEEYVFPVGRLDGESEGLLLFTNDSRFQEMITNPDTGIEKTYTVGLKQTLKPGDILKLAEGMTFRDGTVARPKVVKKIDDHTVEMILTEGKNREIRRICEAHGHEVDTLLRTRIGDLPLGDLPSGSWRELADKEIQQALAGKPLAPPRRP